MPALRPCLALLLTALLAACATPAPVAPAAPAAPEAVALPSAIEPDPATETVAAASTEPEADPLANAHALATLACQSEGVLVAGQVPAELVYQCEGLSQGVTLDALRAAGWQIDRMGIGARTEHEGERGLPLTLTLRKRP